MTNGDSFVALMSRLRGGDSTAASEIFARYASHLVVLARRRLSASIGKKEDPEDVVQSVFRTFFRRHSEGDLALENWGSLWKLLTVITLRKCGHRIDYFNADRRDIGREQAPPSDSAASWQAIAREPTPVEAAILSETIAQLLENLDERRRRIVELALEGCEVREIADRAGCSERTVERVLQRLRQKLERLRDAPVDAATP